MTVPTTELQTAFNAVQVAKFQLDLAVRSLEAAMLQSGPGAPLGIKIPIPWIGQNTDRADDDMSGSDCGPACVAMWLNWMNKNVTVDQVSEATGLAKGYQYTLPMHLIKAAAKFNLGLRRVFDLTPHMLRSWLANGQPVIVLVHYASLPIRYYPFAGGHWILVNGFEGMQESVFYYLDPLSTNNGMPVSIRETGLFAAMHDCKLDGNTPLQGLTTQ